MLDTIFRTFLTMAIIMVFITAVSAATFVVDITSDTQDAVPGDGVCADQKTSCSLRAAITEANALAGADIITLPAETYTHTIPNDGVNETNLNGDFDITSQITINGAGQANTIIQAANVAFDRVIDVRAGGNLTLTNATVRNGRLVAGLPPLGAGIQNLGVLTLNGVTVRDNSSGGVEGAGGGAGVFNGGPAITLINTTVTANTVNNANAAGYGGGFASGGNNATIIITNSSISGNAAGGGFGYGAGVYLVGSFNFTATDSHFDNNSSSGANNGSFGVGLYAAPFRATGVLNVTNCTFNGNLGGNSGLVTGTGINLFTNDNATSTITANFDKVTINGNTGFGPGGGIFTNPNGGAVTINFKNGTISNNTQGGAFLSTNSSPLTASVTANFYNTTFSGNSTGVRGGAVSTIEGSGPDVVANFDYCTITNNSAGGQGGGLDNFQGGTLNIARSIIAGNTAPAGGPDIWFTAVSMGYNHIGDFNGVTLTGDTVHITGGPAMLGGLANNGGPTLTHYPLFGSPVIDAVPNGLGNCGSPSNLLDQRGLPRPSIGGAPCDVGAVERAGYAAGPWSLSGVVKTTTGQPIRSAAVTISGGNLPPGGITVFTGNFGTYQFTNLTGDEYTVSVSVKRYHFNNASQVFALESNVTNADFIANAPFSRAPLDLGLGVIRGH